MRSILVLAALCALVGCDSISHPFDDPNADTLPDVGSYDRTCNSDSDCTAVAAGDCSGCGGTIVGINIDDAARFEMDTTNAVNGDACSNSGSSEVGGCNPPPQGTITPVCVLSVHQCVAVVCDFSNDCVTN